MGSVGIPSASRSPPTSDQRERPEKSGEQLRYFARVPTLALNAAAEASRYA